MPLGYRSNGRRASAPRRPPLGVLIPRDGGTRQKGTRTEIPCKCLSSVPFRGGEACSFLPVAERRLEEKKEEKRPGRTQTAGRVGARGGGSRKEEKVAADEEAARTNQGEGGEGGEEQNEEEKVERAKTEYLIYEYVWREPRASSRS